MCSKRKTDKKKKTNKKPIVEMSRIARENTHFKLITGLFSVDTARKRKRPLESEYLFSLAFFFIQCEEKIPLSLPISMSKSIGLKISFEKRHITVHESNHDIYHISHRNVLLFLMPLIVHFRPSAYAILFPARSCENISPTLIIYPQ